VQQSTDDPDPRENAHLATEEGSAWFKQYLSVLSYSKTSPRYRNYDE
jgi:hypothetical protein